MTRNWSVGRRLAFAFGAVCVVLIAVASAGYFGIQTLAQMAATTAGIEGETASRAYDVRLHVLNLRRFEKDLLLTMGEKARHSSYMKKWLDEFELLNQVWAKFEQHT